MNTYANGTAALQFPSNYVLMDAEEMEYVDGGWSGTVFANNLVGIWNKTAGARHALRGSGFSYAFLASTATMSYSYIVGSIAAKLMVALSTINFVVAAIASLAAASTISYLGNNRKFY